MLNASSHCDNSECTTPFSVLVAILPLAKNQNPQDALEFGTYFGSTAANLALNLPDARIHTLDLPEDSVEASALVEGKLVTMSTSSKGGSLGKPSGEHRWRIRLRSIRAILRPMTTAL